MPSIRSAIIKKVMNLAIRSIVGTNIMEKRLIWESVSLKWTRVPKNCHVETIVLEGIPAKWISNKRSVNGKVILYLHGGAYEYGSATTHLALAARIGNAAGVDVLLPEYRLAPEHPFPAAIEDAVKVYKCLLQKGYKTKDIIFAGDSAGGGLSIATVLWLRDMLEPLPAAIVCLSPWVDLTSSGASYRKKRREDPLFTPEGIRKAARLYTGGEPLTDPLISPVLADLTGLPPLLIQVGSEELLLSDAEMLAEQARKGGVQVTLKIWPGMWHVWQLTGNILPESKKATKEIGEYIKKIWGL